MNTKTSPKFRTMASPVWGGKMFYASWALLRWHNYADKTAYGKRSVLKPTGWRSVGKYPSRKEAIAAAKEAAAAHVKTFFS